MATKFRGEADLICLWCGKQTTGNKGIDGVEHIFPKAIGGSKVLPIGSVCKKCNNELGELDKFLKKEHPAMMDAFQVDPRIKGRIRNKKDRERKEKEKLVINGIGKAQYTKIDRRTQPDIKFLNAEFIVTSETFVRALYKCAANILCDIYGSVATRERYKELLEFVRYGGDVRPWSYAISFPNPFNRLLASEPKYFIFLVEDGSEDKYIVGFIHTSGIWIMGSHPFLVNSKIIEISSKLIIKKLGHLKESNTQKPITDFFGFGWGLEKNRTFIGRLKFLWVVKEIEGKPSNDFLYLLTRCRLCGQTNPTGIVLPREIIYTGNTNNVIRYNKNTWNHYTLEDLKRLGINVKKWNKKSLGNYMGQGIAIPNENNVKKLNVHNCKTICINCGNVIEYDASDCFV